MVSFGDRLRRARRGAGLTMKELAQRAGPLSAMAISKYERDQMRPGSDVLRRLARALGVKVEYFHRTSAVQLKCPAFRKRQSS